MIHDEDLKSSHDYSEGQTAAAHRVLIELVNLFSEYRDDIRIVGVGSDGFPTSFFRHPENIICQILITIFFIAISSSF